MIVVDSNVLAYFWLNGERTEAAHRLRRLDPDWHVPLLWRSEMRSILTSYCREGALTSEQMRGLMSAAEADLAGREHYLPSDAVFSVAERSRLSAYDCEFVALALVLKVRLVTEDRAVLAAFHEHACTMAQFTKIQ